MAISSVGVVVAKGQVDNKLRCYRFRFKILIALMPRRCSLGYPIGRERMVSAVCLDYVLDLGAFPPVYHSLSAMHASRRPWERALIAALFFACRTSTSLVVPAVPAVPVLLGQCHISSSTPLLEDADTFAQPVLRFYTISCAISCLSCIDIPPMWMLSSNLGRDTALDRLLVGAEGAILFDVKRDDSNAEQLIAQVCKWPKEDYFHSDPFACLMDFGVEESQHHAQVTLCHGKMKVERDTEEPSQRHVAVHRQRNV